MFDSDTRMSLYYQNPLNFLQKLQNFMTSLTIFCGHVFGSAPFQWDHKYGKYILGSKFQQNLSILSIILTVATAVTSLSLYHRSLISKFATTEVDRLLYFIILLLLYTSIIFISCLSYIKRTDCLKVMNLAIYIKQKILKLNRNPNLGDKLFAPFVCRWIILVLVITVMTVIGGKIAKKSDINPLIIFLTLSGFILHIAWYSVSISMLLCCTLFSSHLVHVITIEMEEVLLKLRTIHKRRGQIKPGQYMSELCELSDRIDYLNFCFYQVNRFVGKINSLGEITILLIIGNIFVSIISNTGFWYMEMYVMKETVKDVSKLFIAISYLFFVLSDLYLINYGPQILINRVSKLEKVVNTSFLNGKYDARVDNSVSNLCLH